MQPNLPSEIIDIIVDNIGSDAHQASSRYTLRALALVSAALHTRAYGYLFQDLHLVLYCRSSELDSNFLVICRRTLTCLHDILVAGLQFPGIGIVHHVQSARITFVFAEKRDLTAVYQMPQISEILHALHGADHGVTALRMEIIDIPGGPNSLKRSYPIHLSKRSNCDLYEAFVALCCSQRLTTLHLTNFAMHSKTLCGTNIEELHLEQFLFDDDDKNQPDVEADTILQLKSMALVDVRHGRATTYPKSSAELLIKLAHSFYPSSNADIDQSLFQPLAFSQLTTLTLNDDDIDIQLTLFPQLKTLKVLQNVFWMRRTMGFMTKLPQFFIPLPGVIRDLGSTQNLIVETDINFREIFLDDTEDVRLWDAWDIVDAHLTGAGLGLQHVRFIFRFRITPGRYLSYQQEPAFIARNRRNLLDRFPLLVSSAFVPFSLDVLLDREGNMMESTVRCKGPRTGWW
ncbi:hypothetical protein CVT25_004057 [Psilocybe cyanescens]|uniref:Uncharacterized protein n=1 Tax=Psilocybe cyanescens TaxID=93625 RepID=A0A409WXV5_PSICY|nr:hypothetical protein CVT25_004057 [Psilocybe cyanescens]